MAINIANKHHLAKEEIALGNYDSAIEYYDEILEHHPAHEDTLWMRALMPYEKYLNLICREFKVTKELAVNENYEIDIDSSIYADRLYRFKKECLYYLTTLFQVSDEYIREDAIKKMEKNYMVRFFKDDLSYLENLNEVCDYRSPVVCKMILEYCNKVFLSHLRKRQDVPEEILYVKARTEENLKKFNAEVEIALNTDFNEKKKIIEEYLAESAKGEAVNSGSGLIKKILLSLIIIIALSIVGYMLYNRYKTE